MENQAIVERPLFLRACAFVDELFRAFREPDEIRHGIRRFFFQQLDDDIPL
jgi:hypothetical protein